jgi:DNA-binding NtrC family response regulator
MIRVLGYSEDRKLGILLSSALGVEYQVTVEGDHSRFRSLLSGGQPDVLILDLDSRSGSERDGSALFDLMWTSGVPIVVMADEGRRSAAMEFIQRGAYDYFRKPFSLAELRVVLGRAFERISLKRELEKTRQKLQETSECDRLVGSSPPSQAVYSLIRRVTDLNAPVLIRGESGTGKELIARAIHNLSKRAARPFVAVACGAVPETLIEAELFGHEKGAFTGTTGAREGYLELASDGTLFLDEIGELSPQTQVKLLRVVQEREFSRLGSCKLIPLRARILAATHRRLEQMVEEGAFRMDLLFRLNVMTIEAPPLRERVEDIPLLARLFLERSAAAFQKPVREIAPAAMGVLMGHQWPGNVRELENAIQSAIILAPDDSIRAEDLPRSVQQGSAVTPNSSPEATSFEDQLKRYKVELANRALNRCNGNKSNAARSLSISRAYLHRLIRPDSLKADVA